MATPNYGYQKYLREQKKKKKREEKIKSRNAGKNISPKPDTPAENVQTAQRVRTDTEK